MTNQEFHLAVASAVFILLAVGWAAKILAEGAEIMDVAGLSATLVIIGCIGGRML